MQHFFLKKLRSQKQDWIFSSDIVTHRVNVAPSITSSRSVRIRKYSNTRPVQRTNRKVSSQLDYGRPTCITGSLRKVRFEQCCRVEDYFGKDCKNVEIPLNLATINSLGNLTQAVHSISKYYLSVYCKKSDCIWNCFRQKHLHEGIAGFTEELNIIDPTTQHVEKYSYPRILGILVSN